MNRYKVLSAVSVGFLIFSLLLRIIFIIWVNQDVDTNIFSIVKTVGTGVFFDLGILSFIWSIVGAYFLLVPKKWTGSKIDKVFVFFIVSLLLLVLVFTFFAEITFWDEFKSRFNFIAVDYLIYTFEVVQNIHQSYPLYILIPAMLLLTFGFVYYLYKSKAFSFTFAAQDGFKKRLVPYVVSVLVMLLFTNFIANANAEWSSNRYNSEISKAGIYSFFAAMRNNQMDFNVFYNTLEDKKAFDIVRSKLTQNNTVFDGDNLAIKRLVKGNGINKPNVVLVLMESMSASFMKEFGNQLSITPFLDELTTKSIFFDNLYATGTRTVRGMEAMTLSIPPTPGSSIVKRLDNQGLYTVASVFNAKGYSSNFFYGGDGYFDNMNAFFGGNGFEIYDRGRGSVLSDEIKTTRHNIDDNEVRFENAWGICDQDIYTKMLKVADEKHKANKPFFNFIMTTSNHKPYSYPEKTIDIPSGTGRDGAVKYADYALKEFIQNASKKPWFKNTVFVIIADHCASSAGKDEIDVANYHIPAFIYSPLFKAERESKMTSQIDVMPTLFSLLNWNYTSDFFGKNYFDLTFEERAFVGTYLKLAELKGDKIEVLSNQKKNNYYTWNKKTNELKHLPQNQQELNETISWYQTADYLYTHHKLR